MPRILIAGCGFLGEAAADLFSGAGWRVAGLTASERSAAALATKPFPVVWADLASRESMMALREKEGMFDAMVHCASSGRGGDDAYRAVYLNGIANLQAAFPEARLVFTGSTSVYAQTDGSWVDESSETAPDRETGRLLLAAESLTLEAGGFVARLAGIYGPGRSVLMRKFLDGSAVIEGDGERWINQIHRDDAARAIVHLLTAGATSGIYNVVDDRPAVQRDVYGWLADHFSLPLPSAGERDLTRKRGWTSKRVQNRKLRATGWIPEFPDYQAALSSLEGGRPEIPLRQGSGSTR